MAASISKRSRKGKKKCAAFIERLPDAILSHVLSFLPKTKDAVRTSVLSKRWRHLWKSVPSIDIENEYPKTGECRKPPEVFFGTVDTVLRLNSVSRLRRFRLKCDMGTNSSPVTEWINTAISRDVEELDLTFWGPGELPPSLFTCKKLVILKLKLRIHLDVPESSSVSLPNLKILHLRFLNILYTCSSMKNILDGCPVLEDLWIRDKNTPDQKAYPDSNTLCIKSSTLKSITIHTRCSFNERVAVNLVIDSTNLERLHLAYHQSIQYDMNSLSSSVKLELRNCGTCSGIRAHNDGFVQLLRKLPTAQSLVYTSYSIFEFIETRWNDLPMFHNLIHLELKTYQYNWRFFSYLLECSPNLVTFVVRIVGKTQSYTERRMQFHAPKCLLNLEEITFTGFRASTDEMEMIGYLLKNATVLKKMSIESFYASPYKHSEIAKKLLMLPRTSTACLIAFN